MDVFALLSGMNWFALLCLVLGLGCVIFEMFHPGLSAPGIIGGILLFAGIALYARTITQALILLVIILAILGIALTLVLQSATKGRLNRHLILNDSLENNPVMSAANDLMYFIGKEGKALTPLRPSGTADFEGVRLDVVSEGDFIPKDSAVSIVKIEGHRIVVKQV